MCPMTTLDPRLATNNGGRRQLGADPHTARSRRTVLDRHSGADGRLHVTPLVAVWAYEALHFTTGAKEQKFLNLRRNPRVVLITGCKPVGSRRRRRR